MDTELTPKVWENLPSCKKKDTTNLSILSVQREAR